LFIRRRKAPLKPSKGAKEILQRAGTREADAVLSIICSHNHVAMKNSPPFSSRPNELGLHKAANGKMQA
jgi:hypothetical protein